MNWQYPDDIYAFIKKFYSWFDYERMVKLVNQLGSPILMSYHHIAGEALTQNFLQKLGYNIQLGTESTALRVSVSDAEIYLKRLLNIEFPQAKWRSVVSDLVKHVVHVKYAGLAKPMPALIWHGVLQPATFERNFITSNSRLAEQFDLILPVSFSENRPPPVEPIEARTLALLAHVYEEVRYAILQKVNRTNVIN